MPKILIVDDDASMRQLMAELLGIQGIYQVTTIGDGSGALQAVDEEIPDLVVLDVDMPGLSGLQVYERLRDRYATRSLPVLFVTADPWQVARASLRGRYLCLSKPFRLHTLMADVAALLGDAEELPTRLSIA